MIYVYLLIGLAYLVVGTFIARFRYNIWNTEWRDWTRHRNAGYELQKTEWYDNYKKPKRWEKAGEPTPPKSTNFLWIIGFWPILSFYYIYLYVITFIESEPKKDKAKRWFEENAKV
jgi:hypothetical protein